MRITVVGDLQHQVTEIKSPDHVCDTYNKQADKQTLPKTISLLEIKSILFKLMHCT